MKTRELFRLKNIVISSVISFLVASNRWIVAADKADFVIIFAGMFVGVILLLWQSDQNDKRVIRILELQCMLARLLGKHIEGSGRNITVKSHLL